MSAGEQSPSPGEAGWREWRILAATGLLSLVPYVSCHALFGHLFWFGDEFDQIDQMDRLGFWRWTFTAYGENFVPLFKVAWGGLVFACGGAYSTMMAAVWLTHALNIVLFGRLMRACALPWAAVLLAQIVLGLSPTTIEIMAWSVQLASLLSVTFLLLALDCAFRRPFLYEPMGWAAASALSFARGILTGFIASIVCVWPEKREVPVPLSRRLRFAALYAVPAVVVAMIIPFVAPSGNQGHMAGHWGEAAAFAAWFYLLNPAYRLLAFESWGPHTVVLLGLLKIALVVWSLARSSGRTRALLAVLLAFDLGNAVLLGVGRYHTGLLAAVSSRYQYAPLVAVLPAAGFLLSRLWARIPLPRTIREIGLAVLFTALVVVFCRQWAQDLRGFAEWRGTEPRRILLVDPSPDPFAVPGYPGFPTQRAKDLVAKYNLH
jgi:hypothetical protein